MYYSAEMERDHISNTLGPALRNSIVGRNVLLMCLDDNREYVANWSKTVVVLIKYKIVTFSIVYKVLQK